MITPQEIRRRQSTAQLLNEELRRTIEDDRGLRVETSLVVWHGSLVLGRGGSVYDFDYAVFAEMTHCADLLAFAKRLSKSADSEITGLRWRDDAHIDGFMMFEVHTHWDLDGEDAHVGVHVCSKSALDELLGVQLWHGEIGFGRAIDAWLRYGILLRNWVYEAQAVYDRQGQWAALTGLDVTPPSWLLDELTSVVIHAGMYRPQQDGREKCLEGEPRALQLVSVLAYAIEGMPVGREKRHRDDISAMTNPLAQSLLKASVDGNLAEASRILLEAGLG